MKHRALASAVLIVAAFGLLLSLAGCGGGGIDFTPWVGTYTGTGFLDNGKSGVLTMTCATNGVMTGTLTVTGADGTDTLYKFTAGAYAVTGSITSISGDFEVTGTVPVMGQFFIRGETPTTVTGSRSYTIVTGTSTTFPTSQSYGGTLVRN